MTAPLHTPCESITTAITVDDNVVTHTVVIGDTAYTREAVIAIHHDWYGADADGNRGERRSFAEVVEIIDDAPTEGTPERDIFDDEVMGEDSLLDEWSARQEGR